MGDDLVDWIERLFGDCAVRAPHGIGWELDRGEPPLVASVTPADGPTGRIVLSGDDMMARIGFAQRLQAFLDVELDRPVPYCPKHGIGLIPVRAGDAVRWRCPKGDLECAVGDYEMEAFWPPAPHEDRRAIPPMLARRFSRLGVTGWAKLTVDRRERQWVASISLYPEADEDAIRAAAAPLLVEVEHVEGVRTVRLERPARGREPAHRALALVGAVIQLAALHGRLQRAGDEDCDFLLDGTRVRLLPDHQIGPPGGPLVLDAEGRPFANEGDQVCLVGGFAPRGPLPEAAPTFDAGELLVYE